MWDFLLNAFKESSCRVHPPAPPKVLMAASASILRTQHEQERNKERQDRKLATRFDPSTKPMDKGSPPHLTAAEESFTKPYGQVMGAHAVPKRMVARSPTVQDVLSMVAERERSSTSIRRERAKSKKRMMAKLKMHKRTCIVDPRMSKYLAYWDTVTMLAIVFTALVTPYEIAFLPMATSATEPLFIINRFLDVIFIVDMLITFRMMYTAADGEDATMWIADPMRIAVHYLKGWFLLDFVSIAISGLDIVGVMEQGSSLSGLRVLRILRAARLIKLVRLLRASRILKRWETRIAVDYSSLEMMKCLLSLLLSSHWFGCVWTLQANLMTDSVLDSWLGERGYCEAFESAGGELASGASSNPSADDAHAVLDCPVDRECRVDFPGVACYPGATIWAAAVYWAVMTITSIGYGDLPATPYNAGEMWVCTTLMLLGGGIWGYVIGTFVSVIANLGPATREFRRNMDDLNSWMARHGMNRVLRLRLREYFHQTRHLYESTDASRLLTLMSPMLQSEVVLEVSAKWLRKVWFLANPVIESEFLVRLTLSLAPMVLSPGELAPSGFLYILSRGVAVLEGQLLTKNAIWGEDILLTDVAPGLVRRLNAKAINYCEVHIITWEQFRSAADGFPVSEEHMRSCSLRLAMRRQLVRAAKACKLLQLDSALDLSFKSVEDVLAKRNPSCSFKRGKSLHMALGRSTAASDATIMLQAQLMNGRQSKAASLGVNAVNISESSSFNSAGGARSSQARRPSQEIKSEEELNSARGVCVSFDDDEDTHAPSSASASSHSVLHSATKLPFCRSSVAALPLTRSSCTQSSATSGRQQALTQEDRLDKLTEIAAQQASAINRMSQELTALASGFGELMHLVDTKSASLKA